MESQGRRRELKREASLFPWKPTVRRAGSARAVRRGGTHECPRSVRGALVRLGRRVRGRRHHPGAGRADLSRPGLRAGAPSRLVGRRRADRPGRAAARGRPRLRPPVARPAARRADDRLRASDGGPVRRPQGRSGGLAGRDHGHGRTRGPAVAGGLVRRELPEQCPASGAGRGGGRLGRGAHGGGARGAPAPGRAEHPAGGRRGHRVQHVVGVHQDRRRGLVAARLARGPVEPRRDRRLRHRGHAALAGLLPRQPAWRRRWPR